MSIGRKETCKRVVESALRGACMGCRRWVDDCERCVKRTIKLFEPKMSTVSIFVTSD